jgi:hypothetical protein
VAEKPKAKGRAKKTVADANPILAPADGDAPPSPVRHYTLVEVDGALYMVHKTSQKCYASDMNKDDDDRALLDQHVGLYKDGEILPIFDDE